MKEDPKCPHCSHVDDRWHDHQKFIGEYKGNKGAFLEIKCPKCNIIYVAWMGLMWFNSYPREEARDITA